MTTTLPSILPKKPTVIWETLPQDFILPDEPVENISHPLLAAALTESLDLAGLITPEMLIASNMGICTKIDGKTVIKAPDWFHVQRVIPTPLGVTRRSYTPHREGDVPTIVMEFLSEIDTEEYSLRPTYPYGKLWFYEQILQVPLYIIFDSESGLFEVRKLISDHYIIQPLEQQNRYGIESMGLFLGVWYGKRLELLTHWLRWWDRDGNLLLWGTEKIAQAEVQAEQERQRAEQERQRADRLAQYLRQLGVDPDSVS